MQAVLKRNTDMDLVFRLLLLYIYSMLLAMVDGFFKLIYITPQYGHTEALTLAVVFFSGIVCLHRLLSTIISDRDL